MQCMMKICKKLKLHQDLWNYLWLDLGASAKEHYILRKKAEQGIIE